MKDGVNTPAAPTAANAKPVGALGIAPQNIPVVPQSSGPQVVQLNKMGEQYHVNPMATAQQSPNPNAFSVNNGTLNIPAGQLSRSGPVSYGPMSENDISTRQLLANALQKRNNRYAYLNYPKKTTEPYVPTQTTYNNGISPNGFSGGYPAGFVPKNNPLLKG